MPQVNAGKAYWRSLNDLADTPEFHELVHNEFPSLLDAVVDPLSRRRFVQLMGASFALAGLSGCDFIRWPEEKVLPFSRRPEGRIPGTAAYYATTMELGGVGEGLLVTSYDGRPIKIEGNPEHPDSLGATTQYAQASVLQLYDPDRSKGVVRRGGQGSEREESSWDAFFAEVVPRLNLRREAKGLKLSVLAEASASPTQQRLREELLRLCPQLRWYEYEPLSDDNALQGARMVLGGSYRPLYDLEQADVIVSLDDDLLGMHPASTRYSRAFSERRRRADRDKTMNRLYAVESVFSITGGMADARQAVNASQMLHFGLRLAAEVAGTDEELAANMSQALREKLAQLRAPAGHPHATSVRQMARDLLANRGRGVVAVGARQPAVLHAVSHLLNGLLGNVGATVSYLEAPPRPGNLTHLEAIRKLHQEMATDRVDTLFILGSNPVLTSPADVDFKAALERVTCSVHLGQYEDETARECTWHLPQAHFLTSWGDTRAYDGTVGLVQPTIQPLYGGKTAIELLALLLGRDPGNADQSHGYNLVRDTYRSAWGEQFEVRWRRALHDGVLPESAYPVKSPRRDDDPLVSHLAGVPSEPAQPTKEALELVFTQDHKVYDGRFANNAWLQELPDPFTKVTWDNAVLMSPETAAELKIKESDLLQVVVREGDKQRPLEVAAFVLPGLAKYTLSLAVGYGRDEAAGVVANGVGFNTYELRGSAHPHAVQNVSVSVKGRYALSTTQDHHTVLTETSIPEMEERANHLIREVTLDDYQAAPTIAKNPWEGGPTHHHGDPVQHGVGPNPRKLQLWKSPQEFAGRKWGMAIDLSVCTGCSACVVACQAENNIPVVGKSEVARGREMHWLRIDRYFTNTPLGMLKSEPHEEAHGIAAEGEEAEDAAPSAMRVVHQPLPCMQCENAPCEAVCPVAATTHSDEGLNDMVYNRCIGTRYCSNNCPYKVRRFNYFWNHHGPFHPRSDPGPSTLPKPPHSIITETTGLPAAAPISDLEKMVYNPEVTARSRGVMEKCTYCVQRIKAATIPWDNKHQGMAPAEQPKLPDGAVRTACQQVCPTQAIVFGDLNDPDSAVSRAQAGDRTYSLLAELNTRPRTQYQAKLRNPPPASA